MQNPHTIRDYVDYAVFGRAENFVSDLVGAIIGDGDFQHESVMRLPDIYGVKIAQAEKLYHGKAFDESFIGCPNKCKFCHYSWARKSSGNNGEYVQGSLTKGASPEVLFKDLVNTNQKKGRIRTAIDGFSEKMRCIYGKRISNEMIKKGLERVGSFGGNTVLIIYNVGNFPGETGADREDFYRCMESISPEGRVIAILHTTALRPSLATPMQYAPISLYPSYSKERFKSIVDKPNFSAKHSMSNESPFSQLSSVVAERATLETDKLFKTLCFSKKLKSKNSDQKIKALQANFDLEPYLRRYDPDEEKYPGWWLESYMPKDAIKKAFLWTERQMA